MTEQRRVIVLVPTDQDRSDSEFSHTWWPHFVWRVKDALKRAGLDADVQVCGPDPVLPDGALRPQERRDVDIALRCGPGQERP